MQQVTQQALPHVQGSSISWNSVQQASTLLIHSPTSAEQRKSSVSAQHVQHQGEDPAHHDTVAASPRKRPRTNWDWECPACGNKFSIGGRLLHHMNKCCPDLLLSHQQQEAQLTQQRQQQQEMSVDSSAKPHSRLISNGAGGADVSASCTVTPAAAATSSSDDDAVRELLLKATEQEQALRMRVLQLQFVADPGQGVPPVQVASSSTAAAEEDEEDCLESDHSADEGLVQQVTSISGVSDSLALENAQDQRQQQQQLVEQSNSSTRRRSAGHRQAGAPTRQPLRQPQQIADLLQLPLKRYDSIVQHCRILLSSMLPDTTSCLVGCVTVQNRLIQLLQPCCVITIHCVACRAPVNHQGFHPLVQTIRHVQSYTLRHGIHLLACAQVLT